MFKGYLNVARIVQAQLKDVSYFYRCFQIFLAQTMRLTWEFCYMTQTILGLLSVACYLRFAIGNLLFMFFFWDLQLLARKLLSFATIVRLAIFSIKYQCCGPGGTRSPTATPHRLLSPKWPSGGPKWSTGSGKGFSP